MTEEKNCEWNKIDIERIDDLLIDYEINGVVIADDTHNKVIVTTKQLERIYKVHMMNKKSD